MAVKQNVRAFVTDMADDHRMARCRVLLRINPDGFQIGNQPVGRLIAVLFICGVCGNGRNAKKLKQTFGRIGQAFINQIEHFIERHWVSCMQV